MTNTVVFGIDENDVALVIDGDFLRSIECSSQSWSMVPRIALLTRASDGMNDSRPSVDFPNFVIIP